MTIKVHISPTYDTPDQADGGIRRVVEAQCRWLPEFGVEVVRDPAHADVLATHGTLTPPRDDLPFVSHCHGLYWKEYQWPSWAERANAAVIAMLSRADAVTAPSHWVARAISRGMLIKPEVIYHGVDAELWTPGDSQGYVLWNKARADAVSDPRPVGELARLLPDVPFVTTFGEGGDNVMVTGAMPVEAMRGLVARAGVYLATARETFGIGTLEALAAGVPVVGWNHGGQREIVRDGETGYLVDEGDYSALAQAVRQALAARDQMGVAARADAIERWGWRHRIEQYAALYRRVYEQHTAPRPRVSVVITTYNLNQYLPEAIASAQQADEVIVVDDCGAEDARDVEPQAVRTPHNLGLSGARNYGASLASGKYLLFLDADDALAPGAVEALADALDRDPALHIAGGGLQLMGQDTLNPWPQQFDWRKQIAHQNSLHYAAMWRREAFLRTGGYRARDWRAEDASLWVRATSFGLRAAQVMQAPSLLYRIRADSKSQVEARAHADRDGDWTAWYPWRLGAANARHGQQLLESGAQPDARHVPFGAPTPGPGRAWPISHREAPLVSVVIPVGPGHAPYLVDALDSLVAQTYSNWEAIVVNDSGEPLNEPDIRSLPGHPWARVIDYGTGSEGAGVARNRGLFEARAPLVLFLDADDVLLPHALQTLLDAYAAADRAYVYPACLVARDTARIADAVTADPNALPTYRDDDPAPLSVAPVPDYDQGLWLQMGQTPDLRFGHSVVALIETAAARAVGGFDEQMPALEDQEFYLRLAAAGYCGARVSDPLFVYRLATSTRRTPTIDQRPKLMKQIAKKYKPYAEGKQMAKRCCGGNVPQAVLVARGLAEEEAAPAVLAAEATGPVRMRYIGPMVGEHSVMGRPSGQTYRVGNNPFNKFFNADPRDVSHLTSMGDFEVVR